MQLHQMRYFLQVADRLHFRRAAASLGVSQPSVTRAIQALEAELGAELLIQRRTSIQLSELGRQVLPCLASAVRAIEAASSIARRYVEEQRRSISLVVASEIDFDIVADAVARTMRDVHGRDLMVTSMPQADAETALRRGSADAAVVVREERVAAAFDTMALFSSEAVLAVPSTHERAGATLAPEAMADQWTLGGANPYFEAAIARRLGRPELPELIPLKSRDEGAIALYVRAGYGCAIMPEHKARAHRLSMCRSSEAGTTLAVVLAVPRRQGRSTEILEFLRDRAPLCA